MCTLSVSNVIYHKFSHGTAFYKLNGKNVNVMLESEVRSSGSQKGLGETKIANSVYVCSFQVKKTGILEGICPWEKWRITDG